LNFHHKVFLFFLFLFVHLQMLWFRTSLKSVYSIRECIFFFNTLNWFSARNRRAEWETVSTWY
jgi:hypothetical protein